MEKNKKLIKKLDAEIKREKDMKDFLEQDIKELETMKTKLEQETMIQEAVEENGYHISKIELTEE